MSAGAIWNATEDVSRLRAHFDEMLRGRIAAIADLSGVPAQFIEPINPCDHLIKNVYIDIDGYQYKNENAFFADKPRDIFRVSPLDEPRKTAEQIAYKHNATATRIGARKCAVSFVGKNALSFYSANHRQGRCNVTASAISAALVFGGEIVALMTYDKTGGGGTREKARLRVTPPFNQARLLRAWRRVEVATRDRGKVARNGRDLRVFVLERDD